MSPAVSVVPACPRGLSFSREDFLVDDFSVDSFLAKVTAVNGTEDASLERIRDDLGIYLKVLRSSMIELINQDYADFVNLSTNLVGLDQSIDNELAQPLRNYRDQVVKVEEAFQSVLQQVRSRLELKSKLHRKRILLQNLEHISLTLNKIEKLLGGEGSDVSVVEGDVIERVAVDIHHLNYCMEKVPKDSEFYKASRPRLDQACDRLHASMECQLLEAVLGSSDHQNNLTAENFNTADHKKSKDLKRFLRVYSTVDRVNVAENLVRKKIVAPYLEDILTEKSLASEPTGLKGLFQKCMKLASTTLSPLLELTQGSSGSAASRDFSFLVRSLFPEICDKFEENLSHCFSAGNPEKFHLHYTHSMEFLDTFESKLPFIEILEEFRASDEYKSFTGRWNLAVYFQIRFQEIALPVEMALGDFTAEGDSGGKFKLASTQAAADALKKCWDPGLYLPVLASKFLKLTFQILSRYSTGVSRTVTDLGLGKDGSETKSSEVPVSGSGNLEGCVEEELISLASEGSSGDSSSPVQVLARKLILIHQDVLSLADFVRSSDFADDTVGSVLSESGHGTGPDPEDLRRCLEDSCQALEQSMSQIDTVITGQVAEKCLPALKQVADIPRLYRRTNRELPSKALAYVHELLQPIQDFNRQVREAVESSISQTIGWSQLWTVWPANTLRRLSSC